MNASFRKRRRGPKGSRTSEAVAWVDFIRIQNELLAAGKWRELLCWVIGGYTAFRVSDMCSLKWEDLMDAEVLAVKEAKKKWLSRAARKVDFGDEAKFLIEECRKRLNPQSRPDFYLFRSSMGPKGSYGGVTRKALNDMLKRVAADHNLHQQVSPHSLRKCCGLRAWMVLGGNDAALQYVSMLYDHKSVDVTKRYLGITQRVISALYKSLSKGLPEARPGMSPIEQLYSTFNSVG